VKNCCISPLRQIRYNTKNTKNIAEDSAMLGLKAKYGDLGLGSKGPSLEEQVLGLVLVTKALVNSNGHSPKS